ncbi:glycosyltransferase family 4 protein [Desulfovermiculus halophilus]|uniref:glycosyltransferase family 4 protein n=1 Tax=Desulfovermiculus halophilus TaxID=339722 RepID=UPI00048903A4|nr:glycosyltransferase family 4 protein [Desulfovermiculus halophilus]
MSHIVILGAKPKSLINFRGDLIKSLVHTGHRVTAMSAPAEAEIVQGIQELGAEFRSYPVNRRGLSPVQDMRTMLSLRRAFAELRPDIVLAYTIKPVIWGGLALSGRKDTRFYAMIEGLGYAFQEASWKRKLLNNIVSFLYKTSLKKAQKVIFLNPDNLKVFLSRHIIDESKSMIVDGIGIDLEKYSQTSLPLSAPVFLSIGRLLGEKGFREFFQAAKQVKDKYPQARFQILGGEDPSSDGISLSEIKEWEEQGVVEYLGVTDDVRPYIAGCHVYVLASYYGEGLPRTIIEAMAIGRPIITTDNVGCRETVDFGGRRSDVGGRMSDVGSRKSEIGRRRSDVGEGNEEESRCRIRQGKNGFLVPVKDPNSLARAMECFIQEPELAEKMGRESRRMAEERFDVRIINQQMMKILGT